jgi:hypothetical protein
VCEEEERRRKERNDDERTIANKRKNEEGRRSSRPANCHIAKLLVDLDKLPKIDTEKNQLLHE